tara:strand:+ start:4159 stop:4362 length:204 start_codon:yes stop_codon:yes gene_type:complete
MQNKDIENIIVKKANEIAKNDFASGYDQDSPLDFKESICYLISEQLTECKNLDSAELYDFLINKIKK